MGTISNLLNKIPFLKNRKAKQTKPQTLVNNKLDQPISLVPKHLRTTTKRQKTYLEKKHFGNFSPIKPW